MRYVFCVLLPLALPRKSTVKICQPKSNLMFMHYFGVKIIFTLLSSSGKQVCSRKKQKNLPPPKKKQKRDVGRLLSTICEFLTDESAKKRVLQQKGLRNVFKNIELLLECHILSLECIGSANGRIPQFKRSKIASSSAFLTTFAAFSPTTYFLI